MRVINGAIFGVLFDAYGTLFDIRSLAEACLAAAPEHPELLDLWRAKQLELSWLRSLMDRYVDFQRITADALADTVARLRIPLSEAARRELSDAWLSLDLFPDAIPTLDRLDGLRTAILSNGSPAMLDAVCRRSGILERLDAVISVDEAGIFKPAPTSYALGTTRFGVPAGDILFVSSNSWDVAGAKAFGYRVAWVNRRGVPFDQPEFLPDFVVDSLEGLITVVANIAGVGRTP